MDVMTGQPQLTLQSDSAPEFWLTDLEPGSTFMLYLYAVNVKGLSQPVILPVSTLKEAAKRTVPPSTDPFSGSVAGAVAMGSGAGILLVTGIIVAVCIRCRRKQNGSATTVPLTTTAVDEPDQFHQQHQEPHSNGINQKAKNRPVYVNGEATLEPTPSVSIQEDRNAGFYHRPVRTAAPSHSENKRTCLKIPPDFVTTMSDVPESCVWFFHSVEPFLNIYKSKNKEFQYWLYLQTIFVVWYFFKCLRNVLSGSLLISSIWIISWYNALYRNVNRFLCYIWAKHNSGYSSVTWLSVQSASPSAVFERDFIYFYIFFFQYLFSDFLLFIDCHLFLPSQSISQQFYFFKTWYWFLLYILFQLLFFRQLSFFKEKNPFHSFQDILRTHFTRLPLNQRHFIFVVYALTNE